VNVITNKCNAARPWWLYISRKYHLAQHTTSAIRNKPRRP
jgi:hypothetical protein